MTGLSPTDVKNINVYIDSKNRLNGTNSNFTVNLPNNIIKVSEKQGLTVNVLSINIPNTMYNIRSGINDEFTFFDAGIENVIIIPEGFYNVLTLRDTLKQIIDTGTSSTNITVEYNKVTNKFLFKSVDLDPIHEYAIEFKNSGKLFGLSDNIKYDFDSNVFLSGSIDLCPRKKLIIYSDTLHMEIAAIENIGIQQYFEESSILFSIDKTDVPFNSIISYENKDNQLHTFKLHNKEINNMSFKITDEYDNEYFDFPNFTICLQFGIYERSTQEIVENLKASTDRLNEIYTSMLMTMKYFSVI